jgi:meso-butanediol dehydrogenase / (S,S)-butanediol dehydrogenase / diacetyl reductase
MQRLANKTAFITGGGSGIGQATSILFAQEGARVIVLDKLAERAQATAEQIGDAALAVEGDVSNSYDIARAVEWGVEQFSAIDILMNNAAVSLGNDILTIDEETWDLNLNVVLKSVFLCSKMIVPHMINQGGGAIVNIASVNGQMGIGEEAYSAAKAGVINLTQNLAVRYGPHNIRANIISPGTVQTPIWQERVEQDPKVFERLADWYPLRRVGQPEDIAEAALFLASDAASWITGAVLNVDGGLTAGSYKMSTDLSAE